MSMADDFISELGYELPATRKVIERVPGDRGEWKIHPRSSPMGHLTQLVVRLPATMTDIVRGIDLDLARAPAYTFESTETLLQEFDANVRELRTGLGAAVEAEFALPWRLLYDGQVIDTGTRKDVLRNTINHFVHHRAQLTVYLRMNEVPVPCLYGPTADER
jgi:uncharacterized damage-inducible protein DinB